jgi:hypothetical protein
MATTNYTTELQKLYVAYFNRPADPAGLTFWNGIVAGANGNTAAVSAAFAASAEYKAAYTGMNSTQVITQVYQNLFSHGPDAAGRDYWVNALDKKIFTIDQIVAEVANGAQTTDKTAFTNKVAAATAFTAAVDTAAELKAYSGDAANAAAKTFIAGITTDASLASAVTAANLDAAVAAVVKAGTAFTVAGGLADLDAAGDAIPAFLKTLDLDDNAATPTVAADIAVEVTAADAAVATAVGASYVGSPAVKAAVLADTQAALNTALTSAQKDYSAALAAASKVAGLGAAISAQAAADANLTALTKAELNTKATQNAAEASYETLNSAISIDATTGAVAGLLEVKSGALVLVSGVTEAKNPGVTALLAAVNAELVAAKAHDAGVTAKASADLDVSIHDIGTPAEATALLALGNAFKITVPAVKASPTVLEIQTELTGLKGALAAATVPADVTAAQAKLDAFNTAFDDYTDANTNPVSADVIAKAALVKTATTAVTDLDKAVIELATANGHAATLKGLTDAVAAATAAFDTNGFATPKAAVGFIGATSEIDIYTVGATAGTIANFGLTGKDVLYVGADHSLNAGKLTTGSASVLEVFLIQNGANTDVHVETTTFGSATADQVVITLAGVQTTDLTFSNGIISHV